MSDIGAIEFGRWHASHFSWKIGATFLVNVTSPAPAACAGPAARNRRPAPNAAGRPHHPDRHAAAVIAPAPLLKSVGFYLVSTAGGQQIDWDGHHLRNRSMTR